MNRVKVTLQGTLTYFAERTFEVDLNDDETLTTVSPNTLNELADLNQVPWSFSEYGHLEATDFTVEDCKKPMVAKNHPTPQMENQPTT